MGTQFLNGKLIGVRDGVDGPVIVVEVRGEHTKYPLDCELSIDFAMNRMNTPVTCLVKDGRVTRVE